MVRSTHEQVEDTSTAWDDAHPEAWDEDSDIDDLADTIAEWAKEDSTLPARIEEGVFRSLLALKFLEETGLGHLYDGRIVMPNGKAMTPEMIDRVALEPQARRFLSAFAQAHRVEKVVTVNEFFDAMIEYLEDLGGDDEDDEEAAE